MSEFSTERTLTEYQGEFDQNHVMAEQIGDQNDRYGQLMADDVFADYEDIRTVAVDGVAEEQAATMIKIRALDTQSYEDIAAHYNALEAELANTEDELLLTEADELRKQKLLSAVERAITLSPTANDAIRNLEESYLLEIDDERRQKLKMAASAIREELTQVEPIFEAAARPWPVPVIPQEMAQEPDDAEKVFIEDILPSESRTHEVNETASRLIERYGYTVNASVMATVYLMEHAGEVLTPLDIAHEVYRGSEEFEDMDEDDVNALKQSRILTLLYEKRTKVAAMLQDEGYALIYGHRVMRTASGKQLGPARRIYRAVNMHEDPYAPTSFIEEVTQSGMVIGINEATAAEDIQTMDVEHEPTVQQSDIDEIEKTVNIVSKQDKWNDRVDQLLNEVQELMPWLEQQGLMPRRAGGGIDAARLKMVVLNKKLLKTAPLRLTQGPQLLAHGGQIGFTQLVNGLLSRDEYKGAPTRYVDHAYDRIWSLEQQYFAAKESEVSA